MMISIDWVEEVMGIARRNTHEVYGNLGRNTCVHSTRVLINTLRREGVRANVEVVCVRALDAVSFADFKAGNPISGFMYYTGPDSDELPQNPDTRILSGEAWNAHMIASLELAPGEPLLFMDMTADQFHLPHHGVHVESAITFQADGDGWRDGRLAALPLPHGAAILYQRLADDVREAQTWKTSGAWTSGGAKINAIVDKSVREIATLGHPRMVCRNAQ